MTDAIDSLQTAVVSHGRDPGFGEVSMEPSTCNEIKKLSKSITRGSVLDEGARSLKTLLPIAAPNLRYFCYRRL